MRKLWNMCSCMSYRSYCRSITLKWLSKETLFSAGSLFISQSINMIKQVFLGFTGIFKTIGIIAVCLAACAGLCFAFVWPVWYIAQNHPDGFTTFVLCMFILLVMYAIARKIRSGIKGAADKKARKTYIFKLLSLLIRIILSLILIILSVKSIFAEKRVPGIIFLISSVVLFGFTGSLSVYLSHRIK